jgi:hypothetical protein
LKGLVGKLKGKVFKNESLRSQSIKDSVVIFLKKRITKAKTSSEVNLNVDCQNACTMALFNIEVEVIG